MIEQLCLVEITAMDVTLICFYLFVFKVFLIFRTRLCCESIQMLCS